MEFKMKTMKYILLIICVSCATTLMAVDFKLHQMSSANFSSTSAFNRSATRNVGGGSKTMSTSAGQVGLVCTAMPTTSFRSTSAMPSVGSSLATVTSVGPSAEEEGSAPSGPKRVSPGTPPGDPMEDPIGDAVLPLLLLAAGYCFFIVPKRRALKNC